MFKSPSSNPERPADGQDASAQPARHPSNSRSVGREPVNNKPNLPTTSITSLERLGNALGSHLAALAPRSNRPVPVPGRSTDSAASANNQTQPWAYPPPPPPPAHASAPSPASQSAKTPTNFPSYPPPANSIYSSGSQKSWAGRIQPPPPPPQNPLDQFSLPVMSFLTSSPFHRTGSAPTSFSGNQNPTGLGRLASAPSATFSQSRYGSSPLVSGQSTDPLNRAPTLQSMFNSSAAQPPNANTQTLTSPTQTTGALPAASEGGPIIPGPPQRRKLIGQTSQGFVANDPFRPHHGRKTDQAADDLTFDDIDANAVAAGNTNPFASNPFASNPFASNPFAHNPFASNARPTSVVASAQSNSNQQQTYPSGYIPGDQHYASTPYSQTPYTQQPTQQPPYPVSSPFSTPAPAHQSSSSSRPQTSSGSQSNKPNYQPQNPTYHPTSPQPQPQNQQPTKVSYFPHYTPSTPLYLSQDPSRTSSHPPDGVSQYPDAPQQVLIVHGDSGMHSTNNDVDEVPPSHASDPPLTAASPPPSQGVLVAQPFEDRPPALAPIEEQAEPVSGGIPLTPRPVSEIGTPMTPWFRPADQASRYDYDPYGTNAPPQHQYPYTGEHYYDTIDAIEQDVYHPMAPPEHGCCTRFWLFFVMIISLPFLLIGRLFRMCFRSKDHVDAIPLGDHEEDDIESGDTESRLDIAMKYTTKQIPKEIYHHMLLRLPSLYFSRVARIFEEADMSLNEIKKMALESASKAKSMNSIHMNFETPTLPPAYESLKHTWEGFIDSVMREWKTFNIISVLLLSAILTILQIDAAADDPMTRYSALLSLICALMSLLFGCMYIIRFGTMRKPYKAAEWALEAKRSKTFIWWNVWVLLAMPAVWLSWSLILYIFCIMAFVWRTSSHESIQDVAMSSKAVMAIRVTISVILTIGLIYGMLIITTFRRYGEAMDRAWKERINGWIEDKANAAFTSVGAVIPSNDAVPYSYASYPQQPMSPPPSSPPPQGYQYDVPTYPYYDPNTGMSYPPMERVPSYHASAFHQGGERYPEKQRERPQQTEEPLAYEPVYAEPELQYTPFDNAEPPTSIPNSPDSMQSLYLPESSAQVVEEKTKQEIPTIRHVAGKRQLPDPPPIHSPPSTFDGETPQPVQRELSATSSELVAPATPKISLLPVARSPVAKEVTPVRVTPPISGGIPANESIPAKEGTPAKAMKSATPTKSSTPKSPVPLKSAFVHPPPPPPLPPKQLDSPGKPKKSPPSLFPPQLLHVHFKDPTLSTLNSPAGSSIMQASSTEGESAPLLGSAQQLGSSSDQEDGGTSRVAGEGDDESRESWRNSVDAKLDELFRKRK